MDETNCYSVRYAILLFWTFYHFTFVYYIFDVCIWTPESQRVRQYPGECSGGRPPSLTQPSHTHTVPWFRGQISRF
jgi:hypothetical protein